MEDTYLLPHPNTPFGRIVLVPLDPIAIICREFVVEIVITLPKSNQGCDDMIARRVAIIEWLISKPMSE